MIIIFQVTEHLILERVLLWTRTPFMISFPGVTFKVPSPQRVPQPAILLPNALHSINSDLNSWHYIQVYINKQHCRDWATLHNNIIIFLCVCIELVLWNIYITTKTFHITLEKASVATWIILSSSAIKPTRNKVCLILALSYFTFSSKKRQFF